MLFDFILSQQSNLAPNKQHLLALDVLLSKQCRVFKRGAFGNAHFIVMYGINTLYLQGETKIGTYAYFKGSMGVAMCVGERECVYVCSKALCGGWIHRGHPQSRGEVVCVSVWKIDIKCEW